SSEHFDLAIGKEYRIDNTLVLDSTSVGTGVVSALGLSRVGTLKYVDINTIRIGAEATESDPDNNPQPVITRLGGNTGLTIDVAQGDINVVDSKIINLKTPDNDFDASNKTYVDIQIEKALLVFSMDVTGWTSGNIDGNLVVYLNATYPPRAELEDKEATIITTRITSQVIDGINVASSTNISYADVLVGPDDSSMPTDFSDVGKLTVVEALALPTNLSVPYTPIIERVIKHFIIDNAGKWTKNLSKADIEEGQSNSPLFGIQ
ncbi:MAG: hypothetical protein LC650_05875, partial [Actinobacteria bacterium]|nr:hypothetical protein [Actinomycetota bacterium]